MPALMDVPTTLTTSPTTPTTTTTFKTPDVKSRVLNFTTNDDLRKTLDRKGKKLLPHKFDPNHPENSLARTEYYFNNKMWRLQNKLHLQRVLHPPHNPF
jgi:hypothetical protein